mgnify:CR=1 FL=1
MECDIRRMPMQRSRHYWSFGTFIFIVTPAAVIIAWVKY